MYMPAANAMIADIIPSGERPRAFSVSRIAWNVGIVAGPVMGAVIVAAASIKVLFVFGSAILAGAFFMNLTFIRETKPADAEDEGITFRRVLRVAEDHPFFLLSALSGVFWFFFSQWMSVLPVYAYSELHIEEYAFGFLFSATALMTVLFQLWVTSKTVKFKRSAVLMAGQLISSAGFAVIFFSWDFYSLLGCVIVITGGELVYMSVVSAIIADLAPEDRRGTYMGFSGFVQTLGSGVGFFFGMWLLSSLDDKAWVWPVFGAIGAITSIGYIYFARIVGPQHNLPSKKQERVDQEPPYHTVRSEGIEKDR
jgi:MFS family permease